MIYKIFQSDQFASERSQYSSLTEQFATAMNLKSSEISRQAYSNSNISSENFLDQINDIIHHKSNNNNKTVAGVVKELQEKIGLVEYLKSLTAQSSREIKQEIKQAQQVPEILKTLSNHLQNDIINFIINKIKTYHGQISIQAIQYDLLLTFRNQGLTTEEIENKEMAKFINQKIMDEIQSNPIDETNYNNIGLGVGTTQQSGYNGNSDNQVNTDAFNNLLPYKS